MKSKILSVISIAGVLASGVFAQASNVEEGSGLNAQGQALGGNMRTGPGTHYGKMGSVAEGTYVTILFNTGVGFDGYDWFEVALDNGRRGYIWGGILCSNGTQLWGIYASCAAYQRDEEQFQKRQQNQNQAQSFGDDGWMAFATGNNGRWGHGAGPTQKAAHQYAMSNCGGSGCSLRDETQAQCHALVLAPGSHWFGAANSSNQAQRYAMDFCLNSGANGCRVEYTYCQ